MRQILEISQHLVNFSSASSIDDVHLATAERPAASPNTGLIVSLKSTSRPQLLFDLTKGAIKAGYLKSTDQEESTNGMYWRLFWIEAH
jgi:hypothetical protein